MKPISRLRRDKHIFMKKIYKKWLVNLSLFVFSIFVALLIGELIVRFLYKDTIVLYPRYTTNAKYGNFSIRCVRPNMQYIHRSIDGVFHFKTNNHGFRNDENIEYAKKDKEVRILCLGDSHTEGYEVNQDETFSWVTEHLIRAKGINATVINAGVSGFSTAEELIFLENEGYKYQPDFVVLGFFANDFSDNIKTNLFSVENDSLKVLKFEHLPGVNIQNFIYKFQIVHFLGENSYLYAFLFNTVWSYYKKKDLNQKGIQEYAVETRQEFSQDEIHLTEILVERMYKFTSKNNIPLIILDIPQIANTDSSMLNICSSIPEEQVNHFINNSDTLFYVQDMLQEYMKLPKIHVPHGHYHISSETHNMLGNKIANYILSYTK